MFYEHNLQFHYKILLVPSVILFLLYQMDVPILIMINFFDIYGLYYFFALLTTNTTAIPPATPDI